MADPDFGTTVSCVTDISGDGRTVSGFQVVAEAIARRWITPRGRLIGYPNYGLDLTQYINDDMSPADIAALRSAAAAEAVKDERVQACVVAAELGDDGILTLTAQVTTAQGPFVLVVEASALTIQLISVD